MSDLPYKNHTKTKITISPVVIEFETDTEGTDRPADEHPSGWIEAMESVVARILEQIKGQANDPSPHLCGFPDPEGLKCQLPAGHDGPHRSQGV